MAFTLQRWVEITPTMGCSNNCKYCPQSKLLSTYFKNDKNRKSSMTLMDFKKVLSNIPKDVSIDFAGMAEPFLNKEAFSMVEYAVNEGYDVHIFTTLRGLTKVQLEKLAEMPLGSFVVHVADDEKLMNITVDEEYIEKIKMCNDLNFTNIEFVVIGNVHKEVRSAVKGKIEEIKIITRGNNLDFSKLPDHIKDLNHENLDVKGKKVICGRRFFNLSVSKPATKVEITVMLPDGTLLLCCMDYGMNHILGNLYEESYEDIMNGLAMQKIEKSMFCENNDYLLCRDCESVILYDESAWKNFDKRGIYSSSKNTSFIKKIFSVGNEFNRKYKVKHKMVRIFGLKIKFSKKPL